MNLFIFTCLLVFVKSCAAGGILYPTQSNTRDVKSLDGLWKFTLSANGTFDGDGLTGNANDKDIHWMPVPSSYNDIATTFEVREHWGPVKYERTFILPAYWLYSYNRVWLRFGSVCYAAKVYINEQLVMSHEIGHLPFAAEITDFLDEDITEYTITVEVDNTLTNSTIPQGSTETLPGGRIAQTYTFDFFNYAGIDRPVILYRTGSSYIDDIDIISKMDGTTGVVSYTISTNGTDALTFNITILDKDKNEVVSTSTLKSSGSLEIPNAHLWWPYLMNDDPGYLYTLKIEAYVEFAGILKDAYEQTFGIRELTWDNSTFKINGQPVYFRGFGRHEDSDIRGKGLDLPLIIRDHNLLRWVGANSYRTSHYPYAEEIMDLADSLGIMIIDEVPAVNTENFNDNLLANHKQSLTELYKRDKNRPSVVVWSIANEPRTQLAEAEAYYKQIAAHIRSLDTSRPITVANMYTFDVEHSGQFLDILSFNRYNAWYQYAGDLDTIITELVAEATGWHEKHNKPVLVTEYGADTIEGLHILPDYMFSEEYQTDLMSEHFKAFDQLRKTGWFIGEMIWNFADFKTAQDIRRVGGNKKGIFTRERQPKASAHLMRRRYWSLAEKLDHTVEPTNMDNYIIEEDGQNETTTTTITSSTGPTTGSTGTTPGDTTTDQPTTPDSAVGISFWSVICLLSFTLLQLVI